MFDKVWQAVARDSPKEWFSKFYLFLSSISKYPVEAKRNIVTSALKEAEINKVGKTIKELCLEQNFTIEDGTFKTFFYVFSVSLLMSKLKNFITSKG